jgi:hypothetical protein
VTYGAASGRAYLAIVGHGYRDLPWHAELTEIAGRAVTATAAS